MWVRGLKPIDAKCSFTLFRSHPMWVRGLKHRTFSCLIGAEVAPYVGAWIETDIADTLLTDKRSRTLCGCVD